MEFYFAPMEGITGYLYRNQHHKYFGGVDKYFAPFISTNQSGTFKTRDKLDILPENNQGYQLIPQLLSNCAEDFILASKRIKEYGYEEINLNLGCPSGTVVAKNKGAGFLGKQEELNIFLDRIISGAEMKLSIKTRLGMEDPNEIFKLIEIYNQYPLTELIVHPRTREDYYKNKVNRQVFQEISSLCKCPIVFNGDIFTEEDFISLKKDCPNVKKIMVGRGLLANPNLVNQIQAGTQLDYQRLKKFHDSLYATYQEHLFGDRTVLFKMKDLWSYLSKVFLGKEKIMKKIKKTERLKDYELLICQLFKEKIIDSE